MGRKWTNTHLVINLFPLNKDAYNKILTYKILEYFIKDHDNEDVWIFIADCSLAIITEQKQRKEFKDSLYKTTAQWEMGSKLIKSYLLLQKVTQLCALVIHIKQIIWLIWLEKTKKAAKCIIASLELGLLRSNLFVIFYVHSMVYGLIVANGIRNL